jgi:hypothetical protein
MMSRVKAVWSSRFSMSRVTASFECWPVPGRPLLA